MQKSHYPLNASASDPFLHHLKPLHSPYPPPTDNSYPITRMQATVVNSEADVLVEAFRSATSAQAAPTPSATKASSGGGTTATGSPTRSISERVTLDVVVLGCAMGSDHSLGRPRSPSSSSTSTESSVGSLQRLVERVNAPSGPRGGGKSSTGAVPPEEEVHHVVMPRPPDPKAVGGAQGESGPSSSSTPVPLSASNLSASSPCPQSSFLGASSAPCTPSSSLASSAAQVSAASGDRETRREIITARLILMPSPFSSETVPLWRQMEPLLEALERGPAEAGNGEGSDVDDDEDYCEIEGRDGHVSVVAGRRNRPESNGDGVTSRLHGRPSLAPTPPPFTQVGGEIPVEIRSI